MDALELLKEQNHFPTKIKKFDQALSGGLPCRSLCEISGDKRAGKTLFCLQLALNCSLSKIDGGLEEGTLVISTDSSFSVRKLLDMGKNYFESNKEIDQNSTPKQNIETSKVEKESKTNSDAKLAQLLERVHIILQLHTLNEMCDWMKKEMESLLITKGNIRLVIIDSVDQAASLSSTSSSSSSSLKPISTLQRQLMLSELIQQLKRLAEMFNLVVVLTNSLYRPTQRIQKDNKQIGNQMNKDEENAKEEDEQNQIGNKRGLFALGENVVPISQICEKPTDLNNKGNKQQDNNINIIKQSNQQKSTIQNNDSEEDKMNMDLSPRSVNAKLGVMWHHLVNIRIVLTEIEQKQKVNQQQQQIKQQQQQQQSEKSNQLLINNDNSLQNESIRVMSITKSPLCAPISVLVKLTSSGLVVYQRDRKKKEKYNNKIEINQNQIYQSANNTIQTQADYFDWDNDPEDQELQINDINGINVQNTEIIAAMREEDRYDFDMDESGPEAEEDWT